MARPKEYDRASALRAARDLFWECGYEATSISALEERTGLNRSSLYQDFGSKHELLEEVLGCYVEEIVGGLLADLHRPDANLDTVVAFFAGLGALLGSSATPARHGCLLVNTVAELADHDESVRLAGAAYKTTLRVAFTNALANAGRLSQIEALTVEARAELLAALVLGVWLSVKINADAAVNLCRTIEREVDSWRRTEGGR